MHPLQQIINQETQSMSEAEKAAYRKCFVMIATQLGLVLILGIEKNSICELAKFSLTLHNLIPAKK